MGQFTTQELFEKVAPPTLLACQQAHLPLLSAYTALLVFLLQLFSTTDPVGTLLQVPEQISAHLPQPAGPTPAQPTQVSLPPTAEPAIAAQVQQGPLSSAVSLLGGGRRRRLAWNTTLCTKDDVLVDFETS